jgi:hypothetical protein
MTCKLDHLAILSFVDYLLSEFCHVSWSRRRTAFWFGFGLPNKAYLQLITSISSELNPVRTLSCVVTICYPSPSKVFSAGILKISVVTDKREYRIYRKFIGDRNKISKEI